MQVRAVEIGQLGDAEQAHRALHLVLQQLQEPQHARLAGGSELATACDLVYVAEDAQIGYPPVRLMSPPDMQWQTWLMGLRRGMEALLTGDSMSGTLDMGEYLMGTWTAARHDPRRG